MKIAMDQSHRTGQRVDAVSMSAPPIALLAVYLFVVYSRIFDTLLPQFRIPGLILVATLGLALLSGGYGMMLRPRVAKIWLAFHCLLLFSVPFSIWRGGSVAFLIGNWWRVAPLPFLILRFTTNMDRLVALMRAVAWGTGALAIMTLFAGGSVIGRVTGAGTRFSDPNYLGMVLVFGAAFWCFLAGTKRAGIQACAVAVVLCVMLIVVLRTGSRGTMVGVAGLISYLFIRASMAGKVAVLAISLVLVIFATQLLPYKITARYLTVFGRSDPAVEELGGAFESAESRRELLRRSIILTGQHPILGVGPAMFMVAENEYALQQGLRRGIWHVSHNMYAQVSSELGIPALFCFLALLIISWRTATRVERMSQAREGGRWKEIASAAFWLKIALLGLCLTGFFLNIAYDEQIPIIVALIAALARIADSEPAGGEPPQPLASPARVALLAPARS
jgi:hypothetical protein